MFGSDPSDDHQPVTWWRGHPIHTAMLLVIVHVGAMLLTTFAHLSGLFVFTSQQVLSGGIWRVVTYAFVHPPTGLVWFAIEMYLLWSFGRELERFFGRRSFLRLYWILLFLTPVLLTLIGLTGTPTAYFGSSNLHFAIFIAFATLYPQAQMLFGITAKWAAIILVAANSLELYGAGAWTMLLALWVNVGAAVCYVKWARGEISLPEFNVFKRKPKFRVLPHPGPSAPAARDEPVDDIDPLLDKIAKSGMSSLTAAEKKRLENARAALLKKDGGSR